MPGSDPGGRLAAFADAADAFPPLNLPDPPAVARNGLIPPGGLMAGLIGLPVAIEAVLQAADLGWIGSPLWRGLAYQNGAFWGGLLHNWRPNYPGQPITMFVSYAFLHGGIGHLLGNMISLFVLGRRLIRKLGAGRFLLLYVVSGLGGGVGFGILSHSPHPMVGASGALFGLAGAWIWRDAVDRRWQRTSLWPVFGVILGLVLLNALLWLALDGVLAWETHLGGYLAGTAVAALWSGPGHKRP